MSVFGLLERLAPHIEREVNLILKSKDEADTLSSKLRKIQDGLQDAERQSVTDLSVKSWLKDLEDVMYQMDDALDTWETKNMELQIEQAEDDDDEDWSDPWEKVRSFFVSLCLSFKHVVGRRGITLEMKALSARLDKILEERGKYSFVSNKIGNNSDPKFKQEESTSSVDESRIHGRDSDKDSLVEKLVSEEKGSRVISVVGIGGVGKTTLAQLAFNHPEITSHFDLKAWVSVPDPFDASAIAKVILDNIQDTSKSASGLDSFGKQGVGYGSTLETLGRNLQGVVSGKRFLLVLDNVWTEDRNKWKSLNSCLVGALRCRILVTTRSEIAARMMGSTHLLRVSLLSDSDCGTILNGIALEGRSEAELKELGDIGLEIAKKCNGLPLAARTIGSMLAFRFTVEEWRDVAESPLWKYEEELSDVFRLLRLSYTDLPPVLKRCFLSCVYHPKGFELPVDELIRLWMAQVYISRGATGDQAHLKGMEFFKKLSVRSFFQELERDDGDGNIFSKMHDTMHDFANYLLQSSASEYDFILDGRTDQVNQRIVNYTSLALSSAMERKRDVSVRFVSQKDLPTNLLITVLRCVRLLCLSDCKMEVVPQQVGKLIHLRSLDLSGNPIKELPECVTYLYNLQTLGLVQCRKLSRLPHRIWKLMKLRHLLTYGTASLSEYPRGLRKLSGLWTLNQFRATTDSVGYLRNLNQLRGSLNIGFVGLKDAAEADKANLISKIHIQQLVMLFFGSVTMDVVDAMLPPPQIQSLTISGQGNDHGLPCWITTSLVNNLKKLRIFRFDDTSCLPNLGKLPKLEVLLICEMKIKHADLEFMGIIREANNTASNMGGFPKLKTAIFQDCEWWEQWEDMEEATPGEEMISVLPCLEALAIMGCPKLKALPHRLLRGAKSLGSLIIAESDGLESLYHQEFGTDRDKISHIPHISIRGKEEPLIL